MTEQETCWLCGRPLGSRIEKHHPVPKSQGGRETVPVHPICHKKLHTVFDEKSLARHYHLPDQLRDHPDIAAFIKWVANKPPDFHAPTRRSKKR